MKIDPSQINKISEIYKNKVKDYNNNQNNNSSKEDKINISSKAREIHQIQQHLEDVDQIRQEKVENIKNSIQNGTYNINPEEIVEKLLNSQE